MKLARFFNRQRAAALERTLLRRLARSLLEDLLGRREYELGVHLIDSTEMARLNETFLGHEGSTDVITFDHLAQVQSGHDFIRGTHAARKAGRSYVVLFPRVSSATPSPLTPADEFSEGAEPCTRGACAPRKSCSAAPVFKSGRHAGSGRLYGEIFISVEDAMIHARRFRVRWQGELARCLVHGVLHLEGYEDTDPAARRAMKRRENKLLKELSARFDLGKLGRRCR